MNPSTFKSARDEDDDGPSSRSAKAKRVDIEVPMADVDIKLAEKLDNILRISFNTKRKFLTNKTRSEGQEPGNNTTDANVREKINPEKLKPRNLSKEELEERVLRKYDTLVSENDPRRPKVNVKFLSACESIELGKDQARRQMERQLELNSISGNQAAIKNGLKEFRFKDGYEMPAKNFSNPNSNHGSYSNSPGGSILKYDQDGPNCSKSVTFARENVDKTNKDEGDDLEGDDSSSSDCSEIEA